MNKTSDFVQCSQQDYHNSQLQRGQQLKEEPAMIRQENMQLMQAVELMQDLSEEGMSLQVFGLQVSGKTPKYINHSNDTIYKGYSQQQHTFYQSLKAIPNDDPKYQLLKFIPQYFGVQSEETIGKIFQYKTKENSLEISVQRNKWIEHLASRNKMQNKNDKNGKGKSFLMLKNLTYRYQVPNILDLKLGQKKFKKSSVKFESSTTNSHNFRINGMMIGLKQGQKYKQCFISKYFGQKITLNEVQKYLALFFFDGKSIRVNLLKKIIEELDDLLRCFRVFDGVRFLSSSLFICYDGANAENYNIKIIDFDKFEVQESLKYDNDVEKGLKNVLQFLRSILNDIKALQSILQKQQLSIFHANALVVPQNIRYKYQLSKYQGQK